MSAVVDAGPRGVSGTLSTLLDIPGDRILVAWRAGHRPAGPPLRARPLWQPSLAGMTHQVVLSAHPVDTHRISTAEPFTALYRVAAEGVAVVEVSASFDRWSPRSLTTVAERVWDTVLHAASDLRMVPMRAWTSMPDITRHTDEAGHGPRAKNAPVRLFTIGQARSWSSWDPTGDSICAGTTVGDDNHEAQLSVTVLCTRHPVAHLDNPRQRPFGYYTAGPWGSPPNARRATLHVAPWGPELWVAGAVSITGESIRHAGPFADGSGRVEPDDPTEQAREAMRNIEALLAPEHLRDALVDLAQPEVTLPPWSTRDLEMVRVHVRHPEDLPAIRAVIEGEHGVAPEQIMWLRADLCRRPLRVEVEGRVITR